MSTDSEQIVTDRLEGEPADLALTGTLPKVFVWSVWLLPCSLALELLLFVTRGPSLPDGLAAYWLLLSGQLLISVAVGWKLHADRRRLNMARQRIERCRVLAHALRNNPQATVLVDEAGCLVFASSSAERLAERLGGLLEVGRAFPLLGSRCVDAKTAASIRASLEQTGTFVGKVKIRTSSDFPLPVLSRGHVRREDEAWIEITACRLQAGDRWLDEFVLEDVTQRLEHEHAQQLRAEGAEARSRIGTIMSGDGPLKERLIDALYVIFDMQQLGVQRKGGVFLLEEGADRLTMFAHAGQFSEAFLKDEAEVKLGSCLCGRAALSGELIVSDNCFEDERHDHIWPNMTAHGHYIVPLMGSGSRCVGVLFLYTDVNPTQNRERIESLLQIGQIMANAIVRWRSEERIRVMHEHLRETKQRFELAVAGSRDAIFDWEIDRDVFFYSDRWCDLLETDSSSIEPTVAFLMEHVASSDVHRVEQRLAKFVHAPESNLELEFGLMTHRGHVRHVLLRAEALRDADGQARRIAGSVADITSIKSVQKELERLLQEDALTGLASRSHLMEKLERTIARFRTQGQHFALLFFDFDRFKVINDSLGHDVGDELLCAIADRLRGELGPECTVARFGGDEFVVLLERIDTPAEAMEVAERLLKVCADPYPIRGHHLISTASIGVVTSEFDVRDAKSLLRDADAAMYQAKESGRGRVVLFDRVMHDEVCERLELENDLRQAIGNHELHVVYQPIVLLESGEPVGAEALLRWTHPTRGAVPAQRFIEIAEESNQIHDIGMWMFRDVCAQLAEWKQGGIVEDGFTVSVNVSKCQLTMPGIVDALQTAVQQAGLRTSDVKLEVTETTVVDHRAGIGPILTQLRQAGFRIMMDDFGTGHSSLSALHTLPIDELKIDQSFIRGAEVNRQLIAITSSVVGLADHLSLDTVGEGVESESHVALLQSLGCHKAQGYYFSCPLPAGAFADWLRERRVRAAA